MTFMEVQVNPAQKLVLMVEWCKACGICMAMCPRQVLGAESVTQVVKLVAPDRCNGCGLCELLCPDYVFSLQAAPEASARLAAASREVGG